MTDDSRTDYSLWKATKRLKRPIMQISPIRLEDGKWARNKVRKPTKFANHLEKFFQPHENQGKEPHTGRTPSD